MAQPSAIQKMIDESNNNPQAGYFLNMLTGRRNNIDVNYWTEEQMHVLDVRPGITDPASIKFRNENELMERLNQVEKALKKGKKIEAFRSKFDQRIAKECFIVKETPKRGLQVKCLPEKVDELKEECGGYFAIASNQFKNGSEALYVYKLRDGVEKRFDDIKNEEDCRRLRVHSSERMRARLFIQFIAEILRCYLLERKQNRETDWKNLKLVPKTVNDIMRAMASLRYIHIEGHRPFYKRPTKTQLGLLKFYDIPTTSKTTWPSLN